MSLLTNAFSRCLVGHCLHPTLEVEGCVRALTQAFDFFKQHNINTHKMIHHSDQGVQYASIRYTDFLRSQGYRISMPQTGDPLHNALADRINNTLKNSWCISSEEQTFKEATQAVARAVEMYNTARPYQSLGGKRPCSYFFPMLPIRSFRVAEEVEVLVLFSM